ncbi:MAG TPA: TusE/DsrC/DsvC family sulfur relay protein, partial [Zeimonas sp.]|nr:TusE/DsrC/DsvC family sulfur relay protein [Zeimonas sp.]
MPTLDVQGKSIETDEEGYLVNLSDWDENVAGEIA